MPIKDPAALQFESLCQGRAAVWAVKKRVETTFDEAEFLEGAKDAWVAGADAFIHAT